MRFNSEGVRGTDNRQVFQLRHQSGERMKIKLPVARTRTDSASLIGGASTATVRSPKTRFVIDIICLVHANHTEHV